jgi:hypothetical protein
VVDQTTIVRLERSYGKAKEEGGEEEDKEFEPIAAVLERGGSVMVTGEEDEVEQMVRRAAARRGMGVWTVSATEAMREDLPLHLGQQVCIVRGLHMFEGEELLDDEEVEREGLELTDIGRRLEQQRPQGARLVGLCGTDGKQSRFFKSHFEREAHIRQRGLGEGKALDPVELAKVVFEEKSKKLVRGLVEGVHGALIGSQGNGKSHTCALVASVWPSRLIVRAELAHIVQPHIGASEQALSDLFEQTQSLYPRALIILDDVDVLLAAARGLAAVLVREMRRTKSAVRKLFGFLFFFF